MRKALIVFLFATIGVVAQVKENRVVSNFNQVKVSHGIELNYTVADRNKVTVETDSKELLQDIQVEVINKVLQVYIKTEKGSWGKNIGRRFKTLKVFVEGPNLEGVKLSSSARFVSKDVMKADDFKLEVSSSGYFKAGIKSNNCTVGISSSATVKSDIQSSNSISIKSSSSADFVGSVSTKELRLESSSSSDIEISGDVKVVNAKLSSSSSIDGKNLKTRALHVKASSSASGSFYVSEQIEGSVGSAAEISYYGNPKEVSVTKSSSGKINKA